MPAIVTSREYYGGKITAAFFDYSMDAVDTLPEGGNNQCYEMVVYHLLSQDDVDRHQDTLDSVIADQQSTWSEMVDHYVWYMLHELYHDNRLTTRSLYGVQECYDILHEMLGAPPINARVFLAGYGPQKIYVVSRVVREVTGLGLREAKELTEQAPCYLHPPLDRDYRYTEEQARDIADKLNAVGASAWAS